ncbi:MAG: hypothetical protein U0103_04510 [Candidatus Obscuribacterales bacterium]
MWLLSLQPVHACGDAGGDAVACGDAVIGGDAGACGEAVLGGNGSVSADVGGGGGSWAVPPFLPLFGS